MLEARRGTRRLFYFIHRYSALVLGYLALVVFFTGAVAVYAHELGGWAVRNVPEGGVSAFAEAGHLDRAVERAAERIDPERRGRIFVRGEQEGYVSLVVLPEEESEQPALTQRFAPGSAAPTFERTPVRSEAFRDVPPEESLERFLLDLHIRLLIDGNAGILLTALAGFVLLLLLATGVYVHWPSRRRLVSRPRTEDGRRLLGDVHTLAGFWSLPFTAVLGFTGTFFSLAGSVVIPVFAFLVFGGSAEDAIGALQPPTTVEARETVAPLGRVVRDAEVRSGSPVTRIDIERTEEGDGLLVTVNVGESGWTFTNEQFVYDGHDGRFLREGGDIGSSPSFATFLLQLIGALHFGTLAGASTKLLWFVLGLLTCVLAGTGFALWATRARKRDPNRGERPLAMVTGATAALPLATAALILCWAAALALGAQARGFMAAGFFLTLVAGTTLGAVKPALFTLRFLLVAAAAAFAACPLAGWWATGTAPTLGGTTGSVDLAFTFVAAGLFVAASRTRQLDGRIAVAVRLRRGDAA
ncbi:MAG: PepSY-associated TM helix domain-containing protein [Myxococcota bacterium]